MEAADAGVTISCEGEEFKVALSRLDNAPALRAKVCSHLHSFCNDITVMVHRPLQTFRRFMRFLETGLIPDECSGSELKALWGELNFWCAAPVNDIALQLRAPFEDEDRLRDDTAVFVDFLVHSMFNVCESAGHHKYAGTALLPCETYIFDDRWTEAVDSYKYVVAHPELLKSVTLQRWGMDIAWDMVRDTTCALNQQEHMVTQSGERVLCTKSWDQWSMNGAFGVPPCQRNRIVGSGIMSLQATGKARSISIDHKGITMKFSLTSDTDVHNRSTSRLLCAVPADAQLIALKVFVFPLKSDAAARSWSAYIEEDAEADMMRSDDDSAWCKKGFPSLCAETLVHSGTCSTFSGGEVEGFPFLGVAVLTDDFGHQLMTSRCTGGKHGVRGSATAHARITMKLL